MARRTTRSATRRTTVAKRRPRGRAKKKPFTLRWFHLLIGCIGAFCLGYLVAFAQATKYVSTVAGLR